MTLPRMNWLTGAGSIFSLFGNSYDHDPGTDGQAIASDWQVVGDDIRAAMTEMERELEARKEE
jgi:hypothetical protein